MDQLHVETTDGGDLTKHFGLQFAGGIPSRLPAGGGIEGEDEAAASAYRGRGATLEFGQEGVNLGACGRALATRCYRGSALVVSRHAKISFVFSAATVDRWSEQTLVISCGFFARTFLD